MPFLKLGEKDRERLGAPEALPIDLGSVTNREAIRMRTLGYRTPRLWRNALRGVPVDEDGNRVPAEVDGATNPALVDFERDYQAWTVLMWLALRRVGIETDPSTLEFDLDALDYVPDPEPEPEVEEPGKAEEPEPSTS